MSVSSVTCHPKPMVRSLSRGNKALLWAGRPSLKCPSWLRAWVLPTHKIPTPPPTLPPPLLGPREPPWWPELCLPLNTKHGSVPSFRKCVSPHKKESAEPPHTCPHPKASPPSSEKLPPAPRSPSLSQTHFIGNISTEGAPIMTLQ